MKFLLFSKDEKLLAFCREILAGEFGPESKVEVGLPGQIPSQDELCVWDFIPGQTAVPHEIGPGRAPGHLFLVHRKDLLALQDLVGPSEVNVLLKPVGPAPLRAFLGDAQQQQSGRPMRSGTLREERDDMLQFLIQANLKLQEFDEERSNFLARSLHDFRAPLTAISGYCGLMLEEELGALTPDQREVLGRMQQSVTRLSRITDSMFRLSIRQSVDQQLNLRPGDMRDCVEQALHEVALFLDDKRISIRVEIERNPEGLLFDQAQMEQALVNLLDNARKFTPRNGTIEVSGYPSFWERGTCRATRSDSPIDRRARPLPAPNSFRVDIRDSGPGIPTLHVNKIFEEYSSYGGGQDRSGGGLGLAICRMILQHHGGQVWAESCATGAVFSFVLPLQAADRAYQKAPESCARGRHPWFEEALA